MEVLKQMEAVRHLLRLRCSFGGAFGIQAVAVAHHVFDVWVISHPGFYARCGSIRQNVDHLPTLEIDDDRSKIGPLPAAPFIDANHARWSALCVPRRCTPQICQYDVPAHWHA
jgi:hypothetical protein